MSLKRQNRELASRAHIRHALALERTRRIVDEVGRNAARILDRIGGMIAREESPAAIAAAVVGYQRYLPGALEDAFRQQARWAWARVEEFWSLLDNTQKTRIAIRNLREDDIARGTVGSVSVNGDDIAVFKAPDADTIEKWVSNPGWFGGKQLDWKDRYESLSKKIVDKDSLAATIRNAYAEGKTPDQIARLIRPGVQGLTVSAQRIARTESLRIAEEAQREGYRQVGDLLGGIQIWATLDDRTRPEHAARNGTIYPADSAPLVPDEPNCRCFSAPVLRDVEDLIPANVGGDPAGSLTVVNGTVQDLDTWSNWFDDQTPARQRAILGPDRWEALKGKVDGPVRWGHVIDGNGYMNTADQIRAADPAAIKVRAGERAPATYPQAIADKEPLPTVKPLEEPPPALTRTNAAGEPIGLPLELVRDSGGRLRTVSRSATSTVAAAPPTYGIRAERLPASFANATIQVTDDVAGQMVRDALQRFPVSRIDTKQGATKMLRIVNAPGSRATDDQRRYWSERAKGKSHDQAMKVMQPTA
jgi:SPP1 gp7 family putative phage head morphogenesis protein